MFKKIILFISILTVGAFLFFGYQKVKKNQLSETDLYSSVSTDAFAIIEINKPFEQWSNLLSNNIIWDELQVFKNIAQLNEQISIIDSSFTNLKTAIPQNQEFSIIISFIPAIKPNESATAIYQSKINTDNNSLSINKFLTELLNAKKITLSPDGIHKIDLKNTSIFGFLQDDIISLSSSKQAIEQIKSQLQSNHSILDNKSFTKVRKTSSKNSNIRVFIDPERITSSIKNMANAETKTDLDLLPVVGSWVELDVDIKPDEVSLGGFISSSDSSTQWLSLFKGQDPIKPHVVKLLPNRTAFLFHMGFSDYSSFREKLSGWKTKEMGVDFDFPLKRWDTLYDISIQKDFIQWIDNEIALAIVEPEQGNYTNDAMLWVSSTDAENMKTRLMDLSLQVSNTNQTELYRIQYRGFDIFKLDIPDFVSHTMGSQFDIIQENYFTQIEDYIVFANSPATLQWTINRLKSDKTLKNDPHFQSFENRISSESNVFIYSHIAGSPNIYKSLATKELSQKIENYKEWLQKFQVAALQISHENEDLYYVNNYWKYNPVYKKESNSLWELALDNPVSAKPKLIRNHYTNATEIFVQDTGNTIYLISNKGKVLWKRTINEPIMSEIKQIDVYKNNKLQIAFNTKNKIYIIDRNGKDLKYFPINLPSPASANLSIMDYEKNKNYRLLIPLQDGNILNYGIHGGKIIGWKYTKNNQKVTQQIKHISIKNKDYLIAVFDNGSIKALDRKGDIRIKFKSKFNFPIIGNMKLNVHSNLDNSYILAVTNNNEVVRVSLTDNKARLFSIDLDSISFIDYGDIDLDGGNEIIATGTNQIVAYKSDGKVVSRIKTEASISNKINIYKFEDRAYLGYVSSIENQIYLSDNTGILYNGFPKKGSTPFTINDINEDGRFNIITVDHKGLMFAYTLERY